MIRVILFVPLFLIAGPLSAAAQCWECEVQYYPGNECYMEGCWATFEEGHWTECSQEGECEDEECDAGGEICVEVYWSLLDGRAPSRGLFWAELSELEDHPSLIAAQEEDGLFIRTDCSGILVSARYTPEQLRSKKSESRLLKLSESGLSGTRIPR